jgi:hypothetical protein
VHGLRLGIRNAGDNAQALVSGRSLVAASGPDGDGYTWFDLPPVDAFEALSVEGKR